MKKVLGNRFTVEKNAYVVLRGEVKGNKMDTYQNEKMKILSGYQEYF